MLSLTPQGVLFFRELLEIQYLSKFLRQIQLRTPVPEGIGPGPSPGPNPGPFQGNPNLQTSLAGDFRDVVLGDLIINSLSDPNPQQGNLSYINQIRDSGLQIEVVKDLLAQFEQGADDLRAELSLLESKRLS